MLSNGRWTGARQTPRGRASRLVIHNLVAKRREEAPRRKGERRHGVFHLQNVSGYYARRRDVNFAHRS